MNSGKFIAPLLLSLSLGAFAQGDAAKAYQSYLDAVEAGGGQQITQAARLAFDLGSKEYGKDSINTAKLALNLANHTRDDTEALALLQPALEVFQRSYGNNAIELLDIYLALQQHSRRADYHEEYVRISASHYGESSYTHGLMLMDLANAMTHSNPRKGHRYARMALPLVAQEKGGKTVQRAEAEFLNGLYAQGFDRTDEAIEHFETVVALFRELDYSHPYALAAHSRLVPLLEKKDRSDEATAHCLAIGQMVPWQDDIEATPLYRTPPRWPSAALKRRQEGAVVMKLTVDKQGFVSDTELLDNQGPKGFVKETKKMVSQWRYAPKFEDGKPVEAITTVRIDYKLN
ncbi:energy transducer TonB [Ferrimonas sediminicola]|uniref:Energy transducer TonB n=1 Tax=Ferrimonas sediminicola TaxID=2569538 RepID=A0A4U1BBX5_9GAMM|nr:energy transducer TonB [Ferrimonas sediminicola]TKB48314.1 energy transducer TonB [Ferrimonas sediminicola]